MTTISPVYVNSYYTVKPDSTRVDRAEVQNYEQNQKTEEQPKLLVEHRMLGAAKMPKPSTIKRVWNNLMAKFEQWLDRYSSKPHKYDVDKWQDNADKFIDFVDAGSDNNPQPASTEIYA